MTKDIQRSIYSGRKISLEVFGGSHTEEIGVKCEGLDGYTFDGEQLQTFLDRRKPKKEAFSTSRKEGDNFIVKSQMAGDKIEGEFLAVIKNSNAKSGDYSSLIKTPRPSHADYVAWIKYGDSFDYRGGGKFSGRMTAPICIVGGICKQILEEKGIEINAYIRSIGTAVGKGYNDVDQNQFDFNNLNKDFPVLDDSDTEKMKEQIESAKVQGDSVGGSIECVIKGVPVGAGEYMFDSIESVISTLAFAVPAVKGIEFGSGFDLTKMLGSIANDSFYYDADGKVKTKTNHNGGINGGMANGMPITFRVAIKPTPSIAKEQDTINLEQKTNVKLVIPGRHDSCIVPRAVAVIEAISAIAIFDLM
ncbi:MAG: chorismate synthase [Clostridia bacterium]|nr:chorismate synthase [Clostridia bacterium]